MKIIKRVLFGVPLLLTVFLSSGVLADRIILMMPPILAANNNTSPLPPGTVISAGGRIWMDRNLGASRVATSSTDTLAYGDLYQWGRLADGHESRTSATTTTLSSSDVPGHGDFVLGNDWRSPQNDNLWQGVNGTNNPCLSGFRIPTYAEWQAERLSWSFNNSAGAFASPLKLVTAGYRRYSTGVLYYEGSHGFYWSSTVDGSYYSRNLSIFSDNADTSSHSKRAGGLSVRCIKE